mgnify:CR=1 FL=1
MNSLTHRLTRLRRRAVLIRTIALLLAALPLISLAGGHSGSTMPQVERPLVDAALLEAYVAGDSNISLLDTRSPAEYSDSHIKGAINIPFDALEANMAALPGDKSAPVVLYCRTGRRASLLKAELAELGYTSLHVVPAQQIDRSAGEMRLVPVPD